MKNLNPFAVVFWVFLASVGFLSAGTAGAVGGLAAGIFISTIASMFA